MFEHLSASVKEGTVKPDNTTPSLGEQAAAEAQIKWAQSSQALFAVPDEPPEGGAVVPDMLDEANMWEWGGVSFGRLETYRLYLSVKKVGRLPDCFGRTPTTVDALRRLGVPLVLSALRATTMKGSTVHLQDVLGESLPCGRC